MDKKSTTPLVYEAELRGRDLYTFLEHALKPEIYQRRGQRFMNCLRAARPDLAGIFYRRVALRSQWSAAQDPFHDDAALPAAVAWVRDNWEKTREKSGGG